MPAADQIAGWLAAAEHAVAFTGAGISTESGIPDFRSPGGIWTRYRTIYFQEFLASDEARREYWQQKAEGQLDFGRAEPNVGHRALADWERAGRLQAVITQNIDGLHTRAGNRRALELHGTAREVSCLDCHTRYDAEEMVAQFKQSGHVPACRACGSGLMKHATISFGQQLSPDLLHEAFALCRAADLFLAIGSSLVVEPAASMPRTAKQWGARLVIINRDPTPLDTQADLVVHEPIGEILAAIDGHLREMEAGQTPPGA
ncbi:MAG TPA: Sir2 family NAD-dependent protein deacetylase [Pirellulales bacterium]|nr:Sir2 family NAD-dependent protein deacetylase [Pirellulales bacterium]